MRDGHVSPRELAEQAIARIEATNPELNFLVTEAFDFTEPPDGPFRGVPMLIKDLTETAGIRTTFSSRAFAGYVPENDTATVRRMRAAGFTILGKSNTPEFGITCVTESDLERRLPQSVGHLADPGRFVGRRGCRRRRRCASTRARLRRRRLDPHSGIVLRPLRAEAVARPRLPRAVRERLARDVAAGGALGDGARRGCVSRRARGLRAGGCPLAAAARASVLRGGRPRPRLPPHRVHVDPPIPYDVEPAVAAVAREAADALAELGHDVVEATPPWRDESLLWTFARVWQLTPALYPVADPRS